MFNNKNIITFHANEMYDGNLEEVYPAYKNFPTWFGNSKKKCPFASFFGEEQNTKAPISIGDQFNMNDMGSILEQFHSQAKSEILTSNKLIGNPQKLMRDTSVVNCPGIVDFLKTGYVIPAWCDMSFRKYNNEIIFNMSEDYPGITHGVHVSDQYNGMSEDQKPAEKGFHKVCTPWMITTSPGVSVLITHPYWSRNKTFTSVSAVVHPDKTPIQLKWFFEFHKDLPNTPDIVDMDQQIIKKRTPLILLIPFKRSKINHQIKYNSSEEMEKLYRKASSDTVSWISKTFYDRMRKQIGNLYR